MSRSPRRLRDRVLFVTALVLVAGGCAGNGCSCVSPLPNGFPPNERHANSIQARISDTGVAFLENNAAAVVNGVVTGGLTFDVPESCGGNPEVCCGVPPGTCQIEIDLDPRPGDPPRLELTPRDPPGNQLGVLVRARIRTVNPMPISYDTGWFTVDCDVEIDTEWAGADSVTVNTSLDFVQDATAGTTRIESNAVDVTDLDNGDISLSGGIDCAIADAFKGIFLGQLESELEQQVQDAIATQLCKSCDADPNCAPFATCDPDDVCQIDEGGANQRCLQELGMSGRMFAADLFASLSPGQQGAMDVYDVAGGYARTNANGLSLGVLGGGIPADGVHNPCVAVDTPPATVAIPESTFFQGNRRPDNNVPFDVGIGVHEYFLNLNAYAAYDAGFLCLNVGTRSVDLLTSDTFSILVPSLIDLLHGETAPLILALRPQKRPQLTLGLGTFTTSPSGETVIDDPLITVSMPQLQIDFYAMVDQRYVRLFTLQADVTLPIGIDVNDMGELVPILGDVENGFQNISVTNAELLDEDPANIADRFPAILSIALPFLAEALGGFALPEFAGISISIPPGGITSVENKSFLAIFGNLSVAAGKRTRVDTFAEVISVTVPPTEVFGAPKLDRARRPVVELALGGVGSDGTDRNLEWQFRVDRGFWSPYTRARTVELSRESFWLQGRHLVEVRAREIGDAGTTDREPVALEVLIDSVPPEPTLTSAEGGIHVEARDFVSPMEALRVSYRKAGAGWIDVGGAPSTIPVDLAEIHDVEVRIQDEAGNASTLSGAIVGFHGRAPSGGGCECRASPARGGGGLAGGLMTLAIAGAIAMTRRLRGRVLPFAWLAVAATLAASACGGSGGGDGPDGGDGGGGLASVVPGPIGRWSDVAAQNGRVVVSAYEELFGDLVVAELDEQGNLRYRVVDGAPAEPVVLNPAGYRGGVNAPGENVGAWTSIALVQGSGRIAYHDLDLGRLKYAVEDVDGKWTSHVVDSGGGGSAGWYTSLSVDASGVPGIAYMVHAVDDGMNGKRSELRWAQASSAAPASETDWTVATIASVGIPCAGLCGMDRVCVAQSLTCADVDPSCGGSCSGDTACVAGSCVDILPDPPAVDLPEGTGLFASAGRLPDGRPVVAYYDRSTGDLLLAELAAGGTWAVTPLDAADATDTGQWSSLAVAADGTVHVAYQDALGDRLLHTSWSAGVVGPIEVVDDGDRSPDRPHPVGASAALVIDGSGQMVVAYQDSASSDLLAAIPNGDGTWTHSDLAAGPDGFGFFTSAAADGNDVWVSTYVYSREIYPPGELLVLSLP